MINSTEDVFSKPFNFKFNELETINKIDPSDWMISFSLGSNPKARRIRNDRVKWSIDNMDFKPLIRQIESDVAQAQDDIIGSTPSVAQFNYTLDINDTSPVFNGSLPDGVAIPLNVSHVNNIISENSDTILISNSCGDVLNAGISSDGTVVLDPGLYVAQFDLDVRSLADNNDIVVDLFSKTGITGKPNGFTLINGTRKRMNANTGVYTLRGHGYFFLCQRSEVYIRARSTDGFLIGDYSSNGELGVSSTSLSTLADIYETPVSLHIRRVGDKNTLSPTLGNVN
tara:strand:- start:1292 stop:2143 length:852 start_codon:yes stop_codon:yes gene_type:complete